MSNNKLQRLIFFLILVTFLAISLYANLSFLILPERAEKLKKILKEKAGYSIQKKVIDENSDLYDFFSAKKYKNETAKIDYLRSWVHSNYTRDVTQSYSYTFNTSKVLEDMYLYSIKNSNKMPGLTTFPAILALQRLYQFFSIKTRIITALYFEGNPKGVNSYVYLEVFNADSKNWEIQDPVNNLYYQSKIDNKRLNTFNLRLLLPDSALAMTTNGAINPDTTISRIFGLKNGKFELIVLTDELKKSTAMLNSKYFDNNVKYKYNNDDYRKLEEIINYCNPIIIY